MLFWVRPSFFLHDNYNKQREMNNKRTEMFDKLPWQLESYQYSAGISGPRFCGPPKWV